MAKLEALAVSTRRQEPKKTVPSARFVSGGIEGDSHKDVTYREVSLLRSEDILAAEKEAGFSFPPGSLAENMVVSGLPRDMAPGSVLGGKEVRLQVVEKGKKPGEPHSYDYKGWCLLPKVGYFLKVLTAGTLQVGEELLLEERE